MAHYVGLDIRLEHAAVCIMYQEGTILQYLSESGLSFKRIGMETCPLSQWIFVGLVKAVFAVICVEIRHLKASTSHKFDHIEKMTFLSRIGVSFS